MTPKRSTRDTERITVTIFKLVLRRLREWITPHPCSAFMGEPLEEKLALAEQLTAIVEAAGSWGDEYHPEMQTVQDIDRWLVELRRSWGQAENDARV